MMSRLRPGSYGTSLTSLASTPLLTSAHSAWSLPVAALCCCTESPRGLPIQMSRCGRARHAFVRHPFTRFDILEQLSLGRTSSAEHDDRGLSPPLTRSKPNPPLKRLFASRSTTNHSLDSLPHAWSCTRCRGSTASIWRSLDVDANAYAKRCIRNYPGSHTTHITDAHTLFFVKLMVDATTFSKPQFCGSSTLCTVVVLSLSSRLLLKTILTLATSSFQN